MLAAELQALIDQIDECERQAEQLVADLDERDVNWTPPAGGWSVAQCLNHLILMNDFYLRGWTEAVHDAARAQRGPFKGLHPTFVGRRFVNSLEPPVRMKTKTVAAATPASHFARAGLVEAYKSGHDGYRHLVRGSAAVDVNRIVRPNAIVKSVKMRLATVLMIIPAHDRRHLWQAANVKRALRGG